MAPNAQTINRDPDLEWLDLIRPTGLVLSPTVIKERGLVPERQTGADSAALAACLGSEDGPALPEPWQLFHEVLEWDPRFVAAAPGGPTLPDDLAFAVPEHDTTLCPDWAVQGFGEDAPWQLLVRLEPAGIDPDRRGEADGWEASPHQHFERLLRETGVLVGVLVSDQELRLIYAPKGETSGWLAFPLRSLATVAGRPMLAGLKLVLNGFRLFNAPTDQRLRALLKASRDAQAAVSSELAAQVLGALHELLRGLNAAEPALIQDLAAQRPGHLYEGLLSVLLRLVFILYAEDRDLLPSATDGPSRALYEQSYSVRGLYAKLVEDDALNPDTMDERLGGWGRLLALFRLIHKGHRSGFIRGRRGKLFDPDAFPFLEGRAALDQPPHVIKLSDGCLLRILEGLMTLADPRTKVRQRLSYRTLDVEQIGSVYETIMGFTVQSAPGRVLAIRAGKHNRTPVFADLDQLAALKPADRGKHLKDVCKRDGTLSRSVTTALGQAADADGIAAALDPIADERGSPRRTALGAGTPILQPTDERRRTGSHYTPRELTEPIVRHALRPILERLGVDATPAQLLDLKVCDPAMGSGAFLVEACRQLAERLVAAWARHPGTRPPIPADEDEDLLARRLIARRCLYGVDKNPMAVDLARLSLWLATLARDHELTFLDHALKPGDSLVGLELDQIEAVHWDARTSDAQLSLTRLLVHDRLGLIEAERQRIREAVEDASEDDLLPMLRRVLAQLVDPKLLGNAVIAAFFKGGRTREREPARAEVRAAVEMGGPDWRRRLSPIVADLTITPFHWALEFPEVFDRPGGGFDAIVGNPPFAGKNTIIASQPEHYLDWLRTLHAGAHGNADLVAHFFRRAFHLLRRGGALGLIATNTIRQGDTRATGLRPIHAAGGVIYDAQRRIKWPGEAAVVIATVHIHRGPLTGPYFLDGAPVPSISAYLVVGSKNEDPAPLQENSGKSFIGASVYGAGFIFDDIDKKGTSSTISDMEAVLSADGDNNLIIKPYLGGEEINTSPLHKNHRYVIDFDDMPLRRTDGLGSWKLASESQRRDWVKSGIVPTDYPESVAADWPAILAIIESRVRPERASSKNLQVRLHPFWKFWRPRFELRNAISKLDTALALSRVSSSLAIAAVDTRSVFADSCAIFALHTHAAFAGLQSRVHEVWARFFASSMKDDLRYTPSDCFETFPFPPDFGDDPALEVAGEAYYQFRAALMVARDKGLTKTCNDFHDRRLRADPEVQRLRELHEGMDRAVLRAYGWDDLAEAAAPVFLDENNEDEFAYQGRLFWPSDFRDEVLARLLALNAERHADEVRRGVALASGRAAAVDQEELIDV